VKIGEKSTSFIETNYPGPKIRPAALLS